MLHSKRNFTVDKIGQHYILRDDLISGGTKYRGLSMLLQRITDHKIFYAGTTMGHGALALAHACKDHGKEAHIFICAEQNDPMVQKLKNVGAHIHLNPPMTVTSLHKIALKHGNGHTVFPPGFAIPTFEESLIESLNDFDVTPYSEIWTTSVTGTLTRAIQKAFPEKQIKTVSVVKSGHGDYSAPEKYHRPAKELPPYPACPYTDAKLWQFARHHAAPNALIWNTAG